MKKVNSKSNLFQQRITMMLALLLCLFISSVEYIPEQASVAPVENQDMPDSSDHNQTFLNVAVDAVVPFVVQVSQSVLQLIYKAITFAEHIVAIEPTREYIPNQLVKVLFERIISTKGP